MKRQIYEIGSLWRHNGDLYVLCAPTKSRSLNLICINDGCRWIDKGLRIRKDVWWRANKEEMKKLFQECRFKYVGEMKDFKLVKKSNKKGRKNV